MNNKNSKEIKSYLTKLSVQELSVCAGGGIVIECDELVVKGDRKKK